MSEQDNKRRFGGVARLYGENGLNRLQHAHVIIIGIGGVGSWVVEALARNAIGKLTLIDMDVVAESNINRQLPALSSTIGQNKVDVMKKRVLDINQHCEVICIDDFISKDNLDELLGRELNKRPIDYVVDCIDDSRTKAALIAWCKRNKQPIITIGGAGGQLDPQQIKTADLSRSIHDPLLSKTRKILRQDYHFTNNPKRRFSIPCVFSTEQMMPTKTDTDSISTNTKLSCAGGIGSSVMVTGTFGFIATAFVIQKLIKE